MLKKQWLTVAVLLTILFILSSLLLYQANQQYRDRQGLQSAELVAQIGLGFLIDKNYLALQAQLNQLLHIEGLLSVSISSADFEILAKAQHVKWIGPDTRYYSRPIILDGNNQQTLGYAQVAWRDDFKLKLYPMATIVALLLMLLIFGVGWLIGYWKTESMRGDLEQIEQQLSQWVPAEIDKKQSNSQQSCYVVFYLDELETWKRRLQPQKANQVLTEFERRFNQQLEIYAGRLVGNLQNGLQLVAFEGHHALQRCFVFSSGVIHVLAERLHDLSLPLSALLLIDVPQSTSHQSLFQLPTYKNLLNDKYQQLQQLQKQSHSNHLIVVKEHQHLFEASGSFNETPLDDLMVATPNDSTLQLWRRQLNSTL